MSSKSILINVESSQIVVAIVVERRLSDIYIDNNIDITGNIYKGRVQNVVKGLAAAFVDIGHTRTALLPLSEINSQSVKSGDWILVQVTKAPIDEKGARLTTKISFVGRYIVLTNEAGELGISQKIAAKPIREALQILAKQIGPERRGIIMRTEAQHVTQAEIESDLQKLEEKFATVEQGFAREKKVHLLYQNHDLLTRVIRDWMNDDVTQIVVDAPDEYSMLREIAYDLNPVIVEKIKLHQNKQWILDAYNVGDDFRHVQERRVSLSRGGNLVFDEAESLTAIDVNTAQYVGKKDKAETVLEINHEAAQEIARQLRLRNIGGIVVIDFVDMKSEQHRSQLLEAFGKALKNDRARTKIVNFSALGLLQMTRERLGHSLRHISREACSCCNSEGTVNSSAQNAIEAHRLIRNEIAGRSENKRFYVSIDIHLIEQFFGTNNEAIRFLEKRCSAELTIRINKNQTTQVNVIEARTEPASLSVGSKHEVKARDLFALTQRHAAIINQVLVYLEKVPQPLSADSSLWIEIIEETRWFCTARVIVAGTPRTEVRS